MLIGEMRDLETIEAALTVAETGHLVLSTLHTNSRGADDQPHHRHLPAAPAAAGARPALAGAARRGLAAAHPALRRQAAACLAVEVMIPNPAIRNLIREDKIHQIYSQMQVGQRSSACRR